MTHLSIHHPPSPCVALSLATGSGAKVTTAVPQSPLKVTRHTDDGLRRPVCGGKGLQQDTACEEGSLGTAVPRRDFYCQVRKRDVDRLQHGCRPGLGNSLQRIQGRCKELIVRPHLLSAGSAQHEQQTSWGAAENMAMASCIETRRPIFTGSEENYNRQG